MKKLISDEQLGARLSMLLQNYFYTAEIILAILSPISVSYIFLSKTMYFLLKLSY